MDALNPESLIMDAPMSRRSAAALVRLNLRKKNSYVLTFCCSVIESEAAKKNEKKTIHSLFFN